MNEIIKKCKNILEEHYSDRLKSLMLYGSTVRNESNQESDVDLLVILKEPFDYFKELRVITDLLYPIQLQSDRLISAKPAAASEFEQGEIQLYRNAKREGLIV